MVATQCCLQQGQLTINPRQDICLDELAPALEENPHARVEEFYRVVIQCTVMPQVHGVSYQL